MSPQNFNFFGNMQYMLLKLGQISKEEIKACQVEGGLRSIRSIDSVFDMFDNVDRFAENAQNATCNF